MLEPQRKSSLSARFLAYPLRLILRLLVLSCKYEVKGRENILAACEKGSAIVMLWHNRLVLIGTSILKAAPDQTFCAFISNSKDGDIASEYTNSYSIGRTIRVPHDAKNAALKSLVSRLKFSKDIAIITPDGPRGPRYELKPGVALAAKETNASIIPFNWECSDYWELKSWDKMRIPKPFSKITATFGPSVQLQKESSIEEDLELLASHLNK